MTYATALNLIDQFGAEETAQRADRGTPRLVTAEMLKAAAAGGDLSGYSTEEQAAIVAALDLVNARLLDADSTINGYLATRYTVPLATVPRLVVTIACTLTRFALNSDMATEAMTERYKGAIRGLESIAKGIVSLGVDAAGNTPGVNRSAQISSTTPVFRRGESGGFI